MGKRDSKAAKAKRSERRGKAALKTEEKTAKSETKQDRRDANKQDSEDLEKVASRARTLARHAHLACTERGPCHRTFFCAQVLKELAAIQAAEAAVGDLVVPPP